MNTMIQILSALALNTAPTCEMGYTVDSRGRDAVLSVRDCGGDTATIALSEPEQAVVSALVMAAVHTGASGELQTGSGDSIEIEGLEGGILLTVEGESYTGELKLTNSDAGLFSSALQRCV